MDLIALLIQIVVGIIIVAPILWIVGRMFAGKEKAKFTDAIWIVALGILGISAVGGIAFEAILSDSNARDWWLGTGFYTGIIGGILLPLLYYFIMKSPKQPT